LALDGSQIERHQLAPNRERLLTGMHEPEASHIDLLQAFVPHNVLNEAYVRANRNGFLWQNTEMFA